MATFRQPASMLHVVVIMGQGPCMVDLQANNMLQQDYAELDRMERSLLSESSLHRASDLIAGYNAPHPAHAPHTTLGGRSPRHGLTCTKFGVAPAPTLDERPVQRLGAARWVGPAQGDGVGALPAHLDKTGTRSVMRVSSAKSELSNSRRRDSYDAQARVHVLWRRKAALERLEQLGCAASLPHDAVW